MLFINGKDSAGKKARFTAPSASSAARASREATRERRRRACTAADSAW
jgi:hypothetical protein